MHETFVQCTNSDVKGRVVYYNLVDLNAQIWGCITASLRMDRFHSDFAVLLSYT